MVLIGVRPKWPRRKRPHAKTATGKNGHKVGPSHTTEFNLYAVAIEMIQAIDCTLKGIFAANYRKLLSPLTTQPIVCLGLYVTFAHRALKRQDCMTWVPGQTDDWWEGRVDTAID